MTNLRSDNNAGLVPEALAALVDASGGDAVAYGADAWTERAEAQLRRLFGEDAAVFFVATGTAANTLAIAALTEPWQRVLCHRHSHYNDDESTAPERVTLCRVVPVDPAGDPTRLSPDDLLPHLVGRRGDVHAPAPGVLTISNPTEFGTVYSPARTAALCELARRHGYRVHVDGARFGQAVVHTMRAEGLSESAACRALTVDAGVDALSFGGTKAGLALGEAVVLFTGAPAGARAAGRFPWLRKSTGHLLSKHRYVSAQFEKVLAGGAWLRHAAVAADAAERLALGLGARGRAPAFPREANAVFVALPPVLDEHLRARGHGYYPFATPVGPRMRLMCSFATTAADVDEFLADLG